MLPAATTGIAAVKSTVCPGATELADGVNEIASVARANGPSMITPRVNKKISETRVSMRDFMLAQLQKMSTSKVFPGYQLTALDPCSCKGVLKIFTLN